MLGTDSRPIPSLRWRVFQLAWPVIIEMLLETLLGIVDTIMVGRLGADALAGVGTAQQFMFFLISILSAVSIGSSILTAHAVGAGERDAAGRIARQSLVWAVVIALPLAILGAVFSKSLMRLLGVTESVATIGGGYLEITMLAAVVLVLPFTAGAVLRGAGDTRTPLLATTGANLVNAVVAYVLIFGALGLPALGPYGSAWGAAVGRSVSCVILIAALWKGRAGFSIRGRAGWRPAKELARRVIGLGAPAAIEQVAVSAGFLVLAVGVARLGTDSLAAQRIVGNLLGISLLPGFGFGIAATALVGQSLGAGNPDEGERATGIATEWALIWMGTLGVVFILLRAPLVAIFTDDPAVGQIAAACMIPLGITQPLWAISFVLSGGLRGAGNTRFPLLMTVLSIWGTVLFGMAVTIAFGAGLAYVWGGFLIFSPIATYLTWRRFRRGDWKANLLLTKTPAAAPIAAG
jgi:putative MATE family efflux protein